MLNVKPNAVDPRQALELTVLDRQLVAENVVSLVLRAAHQDTLPTWTPGAHIDVFLPNGQTRQYSLCGNPGTPDVWQISILKEQDGRGGSVHLHDEIAAGSTLSVGLPRNHFPLVDAQRYLFIAGGIGITPILPMVREVAAAGGDWTLVYGGRTRRSMAFVDEILALPHGEAVIVPQDENGHLPLHSYLDRPKLGTAVYCCGPAGLIDAVEDRCQTWPRGSLHVERFVAREKQSTSSVGSFTVVLARSGKRFLIPPNRSVLSVLEENGIQLPNSCQAGICGTCLVRVLSGVPDHLDDVLTDEEQARGDVMLPCVSRARSDLLVLDL